MCGQTSKCAGARPRVSAGRASMRPPSSCLARSRSWMDTLCRDGRNCVSRRLSDRVPEPSFPFACVTASATDGPHHRLLREFGATEVGVAGTPTSIIHHHRACHGPARSSPLTWIDPRFVCVRADGKPGCNASGGGGCAGTPCNLQKRKVFPSVVKHTVAVFILAAGMVGWA